LLAPTLQPHIWSKAHQGGDNILDRSLISNIVRGIAKRRRTAHPQQQEVLELDSIDSIPLPSHNTREEPSHTPVTPMAAAVLRVCQGVWNLHHIPKLWRPSTLVMIPKKGADPADINGYRGISLMDSMLKLLCTYARTQLEDKAAPYTAIEQGGFRTMEECVGQVAALHEVCARRKEAGRTTFLIFIDFRQAFDRVNHRAIDAVLRRLGVPNSLLHFYRTLYSSGSAKVRFPDGSVSADIPIRVGVRQGSPDSPEVFKLFINDILEHIRRTTGSKATVWVPGIDSPFSGLLFADDTLMVTAKAEDVPPTLAALEEWCTARDMKCNPADGGGANGDRAHLSISSPWQTTTAATQHGCTDCPQIPLSRSAVSRHPFPRRYGG
jgi:hypothetical protein